MTKTQFQEALSTLLSTKQMFSGWKVSVEDGYVDRWKVSLSAPNRVTYATHVVCATVSERTVTETLTELMEFHPVNPKTQFQEALSTLLSTKQMFSGWKISVEDGHVDRWKVTLSAPTGATNATQVLYATLSERTLTETLTKLMEFHPEDPRRNLAS